MEQAKTCVVVVLNLFVVFQRLQPSTPASLRVPSAPATSNSRSKHDCRVVMMDNDYCMLFLRSTQTVHRIHRSTL